MVPYNLFQKKILRSLSFSFAKRGLISTIDNELYVKPSSVLYLVRSPLNSRKKMNLIVFRVVLRNWSYEFWELIIFKLQFKVDMDKSILTLFENEEFSKKW